MSMEEILRQKKEQQLMMAEDIRFIEKFQQKRNERELFYARVIYSLIKV